ncbi:MAG: flagellar assembly peptidoglycan hydrolase FlgJ [Cellvibrionaceae bacterium]
MINSSSSVPISSTQTPSNSSLDSLKTYSQHSPLSIGQDAYTDLTSLKKINRMADTDKSTALKELSKQFESIFINLMLKTMRESNAVFEEGGLFNSSEMKFHRESFDNQLALNLSNQGGIGLADAFYRQMHRQYDNVESAGQNKANDNSHSIEKTKGVEGLPINSALPMKELTTYLNKAGASFSLESEPRMLTANRQRESAPHNTEAIDTRIHTKASGSLPAFDDYFKTPEKFVESIYPYAKKASEKLGVDPKVIVAQAALETGWGKHIISDQQGKSSHNLFNIKADHRWNGDRVSVTTVEYRDGIAKKEAANFRHYHSLIDSFNDYVSFIENQPRYQEALNTSNPQDYIQSLQASGYATDPHYAKKIMSIFNGETVQSVASLDREKQPLNSDVSPEG